MSLMNGRKSVKTFSSGPGELIAVDIIIIVWTNRADLISIQPSGGGHNINLFIYYSSKRFGRHRFSSVAAADGLSNRDGFLYVYEHTFVVSAPHWLHQHRGCRASAGGGPFLGIWSLQNNIHNRRRRRRRCSHRHHPLPPPGCPDEIIGHWARRVKREVKGKIVLLILLLSSSSLFNCIIYIYNNNINDIGPLL